MLWHAIVRLLISWILLLVGIGLGILLIRIGRRIREVGRLRGWCAHHWWATGLEAGRARIVTHEASVAHTHGFLIEPDAWQLETTTGMLCEGGTEMVRHNCESKEKTKVTYHDKTSFHTDGSDAAGRKW